jgi:hypothetical protein
MLLRVVVDATKGKATPTRKLDTRRVHPGIESPVRVSDSHRIDRRLLLAELQSQFRVITKTIINQKEEVEADLIQVDEEDSKLKGSLSKDDLRIIGEDSVG